MKKILLLVVATLFIVACGEKTPPQQVSAEDPCLVGAPDWVKRGFAEGDLSAVGSAKITAAGRSFAQKEALANARSEIASTIEVKVDSMFKNFTQVTGVGEDTVVDKVSADVSKQITSQSLVGTQIKETFVSQCNEYYVLVATDPAKVQNAIKKAATASSYGNDNALWQQFQAQKAQEELAASLMNRQ